MVKDLKGVRIKFNILDTSIYHRIINNRTCRNKLYFRFTKNLLSTLINTNQIQILVSTPI